MKKPRRSTVEALIFLALIILVFGLLGYRMGGGNMINTVMKTAHDLLLNTVFYLMGITVLTGALSKLMSEFGVVNLLERVLRPLMKPLYNLPGVAALGAVMTFLSDNPAIITLAPPRYLSSPSPSTSTPCCIIGAQLLFSARKSQKRRLPGGFLMAGLSEAQRRK